MGGSKGGGGGSSGKVEYPGYVEDIHRKYLELMSGDKDDEDDLGWIGDTAEANPYEDAHSFDPTADLSLSTDRMMTLLQYIDAMGGEEEWRSRVTRASEAYNLGERFDWSANLATAATQTGVNNSLDLSKMLAQWGRWQIIDERTGFEDLWDRAREKIGAEGVFDPREIIQTGRDESGVDKALNWGAIFRSTERTLDLTEIEWERLLGNAERIAESLFWTDEDVDHNTEKWETLFETAVTRARATVLSDSQIEDGLASWETIIARATDGARDLVINDAYIDELIANHAHSTDDDHARTIARYDAMMADQGAVFTSTFAIGRALIEQGRERELGRFAAELRLTAHKDRVAFIQDAQRVVQEVLAASLTFKFQSRDAQSRFTQDTVRAAQAIIETTANLKIKGRETKANFMLEAVKVAAELARQRVELTTQVAVQHRDTEAQRMIQGRAWAESVSNILSARFGFLMQASEQAQRLMIASVEERDRMLMRMTEIEKARLESLFQAVGQMGQMQAWQTQFTAAASNELTRHMLGQIDAHKAGTHLLLEHNRIKFEMMNKFLDDEVEIDVEMQLWRYRLVQDYLNGLFAAPGGGHVISRDKSRHGGSGAGGAIGGIAGAAIGGVVGGPVGAMIGGSIGSTVGGMF